MGNVPWVPPTLASGSGMRRAPRGLLHRLRHRPHTHGRRAPQAAELYDLVPPRKHGDELRRRRVPLDGPRRLRGRRGIRWAHLRMGFCDVDPDQTLLPWRMFRLSVAHCQRKQRQRLLCQWRRDAVQFSGRCGGQRWMPVQAKHSFPHRGQRYHQLVCMSCLGVPRLAPAWPPSVASAVATATVSTAVASTAVAASSGPSQPPAAVAGTQPGILNASHPSKNVNAISLTRPSICNR
jgi:hypothetical protein